MAQCWTSTIRGICSRRCGRCLDIPNESYGKCDDNGRGAPVRMVWKADSTFEASSADVSMNDNPFSAARTPRRQVETSHGGNTRHSLENAFASSVGTARRCFKSLLFPTSMMTMFESAWSRQLLQPPRHVDVRRMLGNVVHQQSTNGAAVVPNRTKGNQLVAHTCKARAPTQR